MTETNIINNHPILSEMPRRVLINFSTACNLRCPHCFLHGSEKERKRIKHGVMKPSEVEKIVDEIAPWRSLVQPNLWSEPLLAKHLKEYVTLMKDRVLPVNMNTNGLLLTEELARFFCDVKLDTILFSIDAMTPETQKKVRGIEAIDRIVGNVDMMLAIRGNALYPRIGTSFTVTNDNEHELEAFVDYWIQKVDLVRVGLVLEKETGFYVKPGVERLPCPMLYDTMPIQVNGDVSICCLDSLGDFIVGNVFLDGGVKAVWHGDMFNEVRKWHEEGDFAKVQLCARCNLWAGQDFREEEKDGILIRRSLQYVYHNRLDRMGSWIR
jgi:pyruvate-formate lyase-activating enzyme